MIDRQLQQSAHEDSDADEVRGRAYASYQEPSADANQLNDVIVVCCADGR